MPRNFPAVPHASRRGRFAPSPTGDLHLGSLLAAWGSWLVARASGSEWLVRIEDIDPPRAIPGAVQRQLAVLDAFGLHPDAPAVHQSARGAFYQHAVDRLLGDGQAFFCHCSRRELEGVGGIHRHCITRATRAGGGTGKRANPSIRLRVDNGTRIEFVDGIHGQMAQDVTGEVGDFVLRRADGRWAYQLAVVVDDAAQDITQVVRGADLLASTPRQIALQRALGLPTPAYFHLPLVLGPNGRKLSKSHAACPLDRANPLPALRRVWLALGQQVGTLADARSVPELLTAAQAHFDASRIPRNAYSL